MKLRKEFDSIGSVNVPNDKYWGASTQRSNKFFNIGKILVNISIIKSIAIIKRSAAIVHSKDKLISSKISKAIIKASDEVIKGKLDQNFPLKVWQTGSGTQTNMNVNEVIANRAIEIMGGKKGTKKPVHPNDHVNKSQSTNDVFPTAMHISVAQETIGKLLPNLKLLEKELKRKSSEFKSIVKIGRTHLQDATPLSLGQEFSGYHVQIQKSIQRIEVALKEIFDLAQGGTAVGTGINSKKNFDKKIVKEIAKFTKIPFKPAANKFAELAAHDSIVNFSGALNTCAVALMKISNDIRFLGSGPRAGYGELILPENEPGSSIMPGKVNPVIPEMMMQVSAQVIGNDTTITFSSANGNFELNTMLPVMAHNLLESIALLTTGVSVFGEKLIKDLEANTEKLNEDTQKNSILVTALVPKLGYDVAAEVAKEAMENGLTIKDVLLSKELMSEGDIDDLLDIEKLI